MTVLMIHTDSKSMNIQRKLWSNISKAEYSLKPIVTKVKYRPRYTELVGLVDYQQSQRLTLPY